MIVQNLLDVQKKVLSIANGTLGNGNTSYSYFDLGYGKYKYFTLQFTLQNTTISIEISNDDNATADASKYWTDATVALFGVVSETVSGAWLLTVPLTIGKFRIKRVTTNATNACDLYLAEGN